MAPTGTVVKQVISTVKRSRPGFFSPVYLFPVFRKEQQAKLAETGELAKMAGSSIRPPLVSQTCSVYNDDLVNKFTNYIMEDGRKKSAREQIEKTFLFIKRAQIIKYHNCKTQEEKDEIEMDPRNILHMAVLNAKPVMRLVPVSRGGITYKVPVPVPDTRALHIALKWFLEVARDKFRTISFADQLSTELIDAASNRGKVVKKKQDLHKQCEENRAYAHYKWV